MEERAIGVLMIEDNPLDVQLLRWMLLKDNRYPIKLEEAGTLAAGLDRVKRGGIDVILLDLSLPDVHGFDTFKQAHTHSPDIPIIMLTGLDDERLALRAMKEGAQDYLVKGQVDNRSLVRAIRYSIERKLLQKQLVAYSEELAQKNDQLAADLQIAREIQQAFLPQQYPCFPSNVGQEQTALHFWHRYFPTAAVGGDFFSILELSNTQAGIFICDVMGHGVSAALVTAIVRALLEELMPQAREPGEFLTRMNRDLRAILKRARMDTFVSAFYLITDLEKSEMTYASAGHPSPLHLNRRKGKVEPLSFQDINPRPALGLFEGSKYPTSKEPLERDDLVMLYTDGLYEVEGPNDEYYGQERLIEAVQKRMQLAPFYLFDEILTEIRSFSKTPEPSDDVCLVGMEIAKTGLAELESTGALHNGH